MNRRTAQRSKPHGSHRAQRDNVTTVRQPRPAPRRQGTRSGIISAALKEA